MVNLQKIEAPTTVLHHPNGDREGYFPKRRPRASLAPKTFLGSFVTYRNSDRRFVVELFRQGSAEWDTIEDSIYVLSPERLAEAYTRANKNVRSSSRVVPAIEAHPDNWLGFAVAVARATPIPDDVVGYEPEIYEEEMRRRARADLRGKYPGDEGYEGRLSGATRKAARRLLSNWQGLSRGKPLSSFPKRELRRGVEVEREHVGGYTPLARRIAADHLVEHKDYYRKLDTLGLVVGSTATHRPTTRRTTMATPHRCKDKRGRFVKCSSKRAKSGVWGNPNLPRVGRKGRAAGEWKKSDDFLHIMAIASQAAIAAGEVLEVTGDEYGRHFLRAKSTGVVLGHASKSGLWTMSYNGKPIAILDKGWVQELASMMFRKDIRNVIEAGVWAGKLSRT